MPNRIIKESICTSDSLESLNDFQENFFFRLIVNCDDYGRMDARPAILKARLYPLRERLTLRDIQGALRALADVGCVEVYEVDGKPYLHLPSWEVHQQIRAKKSKFPAPDGACKHLISDDIKCPRNPIQSESNPNTNTKRAGKPRGTTKFEPPTLEQVQAYCQERKNDVDPKRFFDYFSASNWVDSAGKPVLNWKQKVITWEKSGGNHEKKQRSDRPAEAWDDLPEGFL